MSVPLNKLLELVKDYPLRPVAGKKGLTNQVSWVHMVGSVEIAEFLKGGELAFTTGVGLREDMTLLMLTETIYAHHGSAIVINIGPYISEIPPEVIAFGNDHDFPVFEVPWEVHMMDIMRIFSAKIQEQENQEAELSALLRCALAAPEREELYVPGLMRAGYASDGDYTICLFGAFGAAADRRRELSHRFENLMLQEMPDAVFFSQPEGDAVLLHAAEQTAGSTARRIAQRLGCFLRENESVRISVGKGASRLREISESYRLAHLLMEFMAREEDPGVVCTYADSGMAGLLFQIRDKAALEHFYAQTIKPLADYDRTHDGNLVQVLEAYFRYNGSIRKMAEVFYVHRNTVNYKLKKIEEITGADLGDYSVRTRLETGLLAGKIKELL